MKYYVGEIITYFGESDVSTMVKFKTIGKPENCLDKIASDFWGNSSERHFDTGLYDFGDRMTGVGRWQEIDKATFIALSIVPEIIK